MSSPRIVVHIDELVLHGFSPRDRWRIADAIQAELARSLAAGRGPFPGGGTRAAAPDRLDAGTVHVADPTRARAIGAQVGRALYGALRR